MGGRWTDAKMDGRREGGLEHRWIHGRREEKKGEFMIGWMENELMQGWKMERWMMNGGWWVAIWKEGWMEGHIDE